MPRKPLRARKREQAKGTSRTAAPSVKSITLPITEGMEESRRTRAFYRRMAALFDKQQALFNAFDAANHINGHPVNLRELILGKEDKDA